MLPAKCAARAAVRLVPNNAAAATPLLKRYVSESRYAGQKASLQPQATTEHGSGGEPLRPAAAQMGNMLEIGCRSVFTPENDMFREHVRRFMRERLAPLQNSFEEEGQPSREIWKEMGAQGLLGVSTPAEVGGIGGTFLDEAIVAEEMSYANCASPAMAVHSTICMPYITHYGTKDRA